MSITWQYELFFFYFFMNIDDSTAETIIIMLQELTQIKIDAFNEGMLKAAEIADSFADYDTSRDGRRIGKAIRNEI